MTITEEISLCSMLVALVAVTVGPLISGWVAHRQIISSMRQQWIENLRIAVAEFLSEVDHIVTFHDPVDSDHDFDEAASKRMNFLENRIELTLNPQKKRSQRLIAAVHQLADLTSKRDLPDEQRVDTYARLSLDIVSITQEILQVEWKKTKRVLPFRRYDDVQT